MNASMSSNITFVISKNNPRYCNDVSSSLSLTLVVLYSFAFLNLFFASFLYNIEENIKPQLKLNCIKYKSIKTQ